MEIYEKVSTSMNFVEREKKVRRLWEENGIFEKSIKIREGAPSYTFYDGPPTANGKPHIGHVLTRVIKDMVPRYQTMKGKSVLRKAGWDTHGLPVELEVEKKLGIDGKDQIEAYGLEPFIAHCKESVWKYKEMWEDFSGTVGFWADMEHPYVTYTNDFIESAQGNMEQGASLQGLQNRSLLSAMRHSPLEPRGSAGVQDRQGALGCRALQVCRRGRVFPCVDYHSLDASLERCALR